MFEIIGAVVGNTVAPLGGGIATMVAEVVVVVVVVVDVDFVDEPLERRGVGTDSFFFFFFFFFFFLPSIVSVPPVSLL